MFVSGLTTSYLGALWLKRVLKRVTGALLMSAAASSAAPWEIRAALRAGAEDERSRASSGDSEAQEQISCDAAGNLVVEYLMSLLTHRRPMSARTTCTICWWASKAGARGSVESFALNPESQTGKLQAHLDKASGVSLQEDARVR